MPRYAMIDEPSSIVVNVIMWDGNEETWRPPEGYLMIEDVNNEAGPGYTYEDGAFTPPPGGQPSGI